MDYKARTIVAELIDNDRESDVIFSDAKIILSLYRKKDLSLNELLRLMQVRRAQRYRRLKKLEDREFIEQYLDPDPEDGLRKRKTFARLTGLGKRVARVLNEHEYFKDFRVIVPKEHITPTPYRKPVYIEPESEPEIQFPSRESIFEAIDDADEFIDDEEESDDEEFIEEVEVFKIEDFIESLKRGSKNGKNTTRN